MSNESLYLVKLQFKSSVVGGGSMEIQLAVDPVTGSLNGRANGSIQEGTQHSPHFTSSASGHMHATGFNGVTKVGAVTGQAVVSFPPPAIGSYQSPFTASFGVDNEYNGKGSFSVGDNTYQCEVSLID
ncbi:hypothetical protein AMS58_01145 [Pseudoalteromonas porphyrae]|uniref:DUF1842 domain-containing protein n=2 Tax=Pseudoalteromonas TaxID=53246 RepID=A0A0N0LUQ8_9GAMM|nr:MULTISPECIES: DUF1842 domain-containing protein [Pseudoalteromonas]KPH56679.1 hypothetical protein ADS77_20700 [Pseudoalteromonas porphyrae]KPH96698.1 hypothetical protein AMS58_01145 [Pseudoalteromonas porphyrae]NNG43424.1 DUF1842 domain-containing protein [Pseudoalteromonas sp. NEC-BIFX-2020_002]